MDTLRLRPAWILIFIFFTSCSSLLDISPIGIKRSLRTIRSDLNLTVEWEYPSIYSSSDSNAKIRGLKSIVDSSESTTILLVHGIRRKEVNYFSPFIESISIKLGINTKDHKNYDIEESVYEANGFKLKPAVDTSKIPTICVIDIKNKDNNPPKHVKFIVVHWSPITDPAKNALYSYNFDSSRTKLSDHIKEYYLIDAIADLALYQNPQYNNQIDSLIKFSLQQIETNNDPKKNPVILIGGSLGSQIIADQINGAKRLDIQKRITQIYYLSNQLPFSAYFTTNPSFPLDVESMADRIYGKNQSDKAFKGLSPLHPPEITEKVQVVNFFDPSDVIGFKLPISHVPNNFNVFNVKTHNTLGWKMNPHSLKQKYLTQIGDQKISRFSNSLLDLHTDQQDIRININQLNEGPIKNQDLVEFIVNGERRTDGSLKINEGINERKPLVELKTNYPRLAKKKKRFLHINGMGIARALSFGKLFRRIQKIDIKPAVLPYELPDDKLPNSEAALSFEGIEESVHKNRTTRIMTIHGMRFKKPDHFDEMAVEIARSLNFDPIPNVSMKEIPFYRNEQDIKRKIPSHAAVRFLEFTNSEKKQLQFVIMYWSPLTKPTKDFINTYDTTGISREIAIGPKLLKQEIVLGGIADVALTLNGYRKAIYKVLDVGFQDLASPQLPGMPISYNYQLNTKNTYFITGSLGTTLLYDYLEDRINSQNHLYVNQVLDRLNTFFMLTNPLPLLSLVRGNNFDARELLKDEMFGEFPMEYQSLTGRKLKIVNFYDPNDILNFSLEDIPENQKRYLDLQTVYLNIGQGYSLNKKQLYKLGKKVERKFFTKGEKEKMNPYVHPNYSSLIDEVKGDSLYGNKDHKKLKKLQRKTLFILPHLLKLLEKGYGKDRKNLNNPKQTFVVAFDETHEGVKDDNRILEMLSYGTSRIGRTNPTHALQGY